MGLVIRDMKKDDKAEVKAMMDVFYNSQAVFTNGSDKIFENDIENCVNDNPFLEGYVFERENTVCGYAMVAKSFSTEFGKPCIWLEDLYINENFRGDGIGGAFLDYLKEKYKNCIIRLEVESENSTAVALYGKKGFTVLPYMEMKI